MPDPSISMYGFMAQCMVLKEFKARLDSIAVSLFTNSETAAATPLRVMQNF